MNGAEEKRSASTEKELSGERSDEEEKEKLSFLISIDCSRRCSELLTKKRERRAENSKLEL